MQVNYRDGSGYSGYSAVTTHLFTSHSRSKVDMCQVYRRSIAECHKVKYQFHCNYTYQKQLFEIRRFKYHNANVQHYVT